MKTKKRKALIRRKTSETDIRAEVSIDGRGKREFSTGIPFLNHMLDLFAKHGLFDVTLKAKGDLEVDIHHTNEDVGITLGQTLRKALGDKKGIRRYGFASVPMDDTLARVTLDISGRPSLHISKNKGVRFSRLENYSFRDTTEFLEALCQNSGINMHIEILAGNDTHHIIEGIFKALGRALDMATQIDPRVQGIPSTKGAL